jgi:phosphotriesterase-related protein
MAHDHLLCFQPGIGDYQHSGQVITDDAMWDAQITLENVGWIRLNWLSNKSNLTLDEFDVALAELRQYADAGGGTIADPTVPGLGRDPEALARLSVETGVHIIMGCGFYVAETHPAELANLPTEQMADLIVRDLIEGVDGTDVRAGFIGEVGCTWPLQDEEKRALRASAQAQAITGSALMIHPGRHPSAPVEILQILDDAGADLSRTIMGHVDRTIPTPEGLLEVARYGCYLSLDVFGLETSMYPFFATGLDVPSDAQRLQKVEHLRDNGHTSQILVSQDICTKTRLSRYGGHGYDYLLKFVRPWLSRRGATDEFLDDVFAANPQRVFSLPQQ